MDTRLVLRDFLARITGAGVVIGRSWLGFSGFRRNCPPDLAMKFRGLDWESLVSVCVMENDIMGTTDNLELFRSLMRHMGYREAQQTAKRIAEDRVKAEVKKDSEKKLK